MQTLQDAGVKLDDKHVWVVFNKTDLPDADKLAKQGIAVSSRTGAGLDRLREALAKAVDKDVSAASQTLLTNARHYDALGRSNEALLHVKQGLRDGIPADLVATDLRDAIYHLGSISGEVASDDILDNIFSRFCIGK